jgi:sulfur relay (sulfurtransferase) DsrF/TusC family protein
MASYLFIESRNPWESNAVRGSYDLARELAGAGHEVALFLVQNGVMPARQGAEDVGLQALVGAVTLLADDFSLRERAIPPDRLMAGVAPAPIEVVVDALARGVRTLWH